MTGHGGWLAQVDATARARTPPSTSRALRVPDPLNEGRPRKVGPSGTLAGVYARTDATRGVWKAPGRHRRALPARTLDGASSTDLENGALNPLGVNALRNFPIFGNVVWGARTLDGADQQASEWKYIPVRRTALYIEESLYQGLKWVVFEPNDEPLWAQIRLNVGAFMNDLFRQGAFQGTTPREAYFVKCDADTTTQNDIDRGDREHPRRLRAAQAGRVRRHQDPADRRPDRDLRRRPMAQFTVNPHRFDPYKNFKFRVKWDGRYVAGVSKVTRPQAHHRGGQAPRGRRPEHEPQVARPHRVRADHARARRHPRPRVRGVGEQGLELRRRPRRARSR